MSFPKPYKIDVPQSKVDVLNKKLSLAEFPDELEGAGWDLGSPLADVKRLTKAWEQFDWRKAEQKLNELPHFTTDIEIDGFETLNVHFIHQKSDRKGAIPLLFVHGWPGSFIEVTEILPLLAHRDKNSPAFHVVAPSLPNYGFSQGVSKRGFALAQYAETCHKLMLQLGYDEYVTQGGDWGYYITRAIGSLYPESCKASHINMVPAKRPSFGKNPILALQHSVTPYTKAERQVFERSQWFMEEGFGYNLLQSTKPQTLGYALTDSPVALLSWIYEKLHDWTDSYPWTDDQILTWVSIYQFSRAGPGAAHRIYYEVMHTSKNKEGVHGRPMTRDDCDSYINHVKYGVTLNPKEIRIAPKLWTGTLGEIVYVAENEVGGHFYAKELPGLLARDLRTMFGKGGGACGVVKGSDGFD